MHGRIISAPTIYQQMTIKAYAKINLSLDITRKREDGYHEIETLMQTVSLHDTLHIEKSDRIKITCNETYMPTDKRNTIFNIAERFFAMTKIKGGVHVDLVKRIPTGAGLGGGSSDACSTLIALDKLYGTQLARDEMAQLCAATGADVPYFLTGGLAVCKGIGEKVERLSPLPKVYVLILKPHFKISTKWVYNNLDVTKIHRHPPTDTIIELLNQRRYAKAFSNIKNVLENVSARQYPQIQNLKRRLMGKGAYNALMSGSGSAVYGLFRTHEQMKKASYDLRKHCQEIFLTETIDSTEMM